MVVLLKHPENIDQEVTCYEEATEPSNLILGLHCGHQVRKAHHTVQCQQEYHLVEVLLPLDERIFVWPRKAQDCYRYYKIGYHGVYLHNEMLLCHYNHCK
jgi:hypothetical protein